MVVTPSDVCVGDGDNLVARVTASGVEPADRDFWVVPVQDFLEQVACKDIENAIKDLNHIIMSDRNCITQSCYIYLFTLFGNSYTCTYSAIHIETRACVSAGIHGDGCSVRYKGVIHSTSCPTFTVNFRYVDGANERIGKNTLVAGKASPEQEKSG